MMLKFLANTLEQLDLALDQLAIADTNYKRFTLMLVDNVVELTLHRHAQDISNEQKYFKYSKKPPYPSEIIQAALGQSFEAKAKLAQESGLLTPIEKQSIVTLHSFRNEVYHQGIAHEPILPAISLFYFKSACHFLGNLKIGGVTWRMGEPIPHRAKKYLGPNPSWTIRDSFPAACQRLRDIANEFPINICQDLAAHIAEVIDTMDGCIDFLASDGPKKMTRDQVIIDAQAWPFMFSDEGREFISKSNCTAKTVQQYADWCKANVPWKVRTDPIPSWKKRLASLQSEKDEHAALHKYRCFMSQTDKLRTEISSAASALDSHIQHLIDQARGK